jgi:hypothetical protein
MSSGERKDKATERRECLQCSAAFMSEPYTNPKRGRYCSRPCASKAKLASNSSLAKANRAKSHCKNGHEFTPENTILMPGDRRNCRECRKVIHKRVREKRKAGLLPPLLPPTPEEFMAKVNKTDSCWLWTGAKAPPWNYGRTGQLWAHRVSYELHVGPITEGLYVLHRCDNPPCVNPSHLFLGTAADNVQDMMAKGRHASQKDRCLAKRPKKSRPARGK